MKKQNKTQKLQKQKSVVKSKKVPKQDIVNDKEVDVKEKQVIKKSKEKYKSNITDAKIKKLLDFEHIEELYFLLHILNDKQLNSFIKHYNNSQISKTSDMKIDKIIKNSTQSYELLDAVLNELVVRLQDEYAELRSEISELRKSGVDVYIEDIKSMIIPLKIKLYSSTSNKEDYYKVKKIIYEIKKIVDEKKIVLDKKLEEEKILAQKKAKKKVGEKQEGEVKGKPTTSVPPTQR